ncbi:MAG: hypothetical protein ACK2UK_20065 [Candidatus Promineifilaceae bacterium]
MSRLIVEAEAVNAWGQGIEEFEREGVGRALVVSVTNADGEPVKELGGGAFDAYFLPPTPSALSFEKLHIVHADEQRPGVYILIGTASPQKLVLAGKHVFAVMVFKSGRMGQALTSLTV